VPNNWIKVFMTGVASATRDALPAHLGWIPLLDPDPSPAAAAAGRGRPWLA